MGIHAEQTETVIKKNSSAVYAELICEHHHTAVGCRHRSMFGRSQISAQMDLAINYLAVIGIGAVIGETRAGR